MRVQSSAVLFLGLVLGLVSVTGCEDRNGQPLPPPPRAVVLEAVHTKLALKFLPGVSKYERSRVAETVTDMLLAKFDGDGRVDFFSAAFGGKDMGAVANYLNERLNYILPFKQYVTEIDPPKYESDAQALKGMGAANISMPIYFERMVSSNGAPENKPLILGDKTHIVRSPRIGIMVVGPAFLSDAPYNLAGMPVKLTWVNRSSTLVHEARHSDCPKAPTLDQMKNFYVFGATTRELRQCGYMHSVCESFLSSDVVLGGPAPHPYAGIAACDDLPWGAYGVEVAYLRRLTTCASCSEPERQEAAMGMLDSMFRLTGSELLEGSPDLSSI